MLGANAGSSSSVGHKNVFLGDEAGKNNINGGENTFIGKSAGNANTSGSYNYFAGSYAGNSNTTGSQNIFIGNYAGASNTTGIQNIFIGKNAGYAETNSNRLYIENSSATSVNALIYGEFDNDVLKLNATVNVRDALSLKPLDTAPANPEKGTMYFDNTTNKLRVWDGTAWQDCW